MRLSRALFSILIVSLFLSLLVISSPVRAQEEAAEEAAPATVDEKKPTILATANEIIFKVLFFDIAYGKIRIGEVDRDGAPILNTDGNQTKRTVGLPFLVVVLICGSIFFTFWFRWINIRGFRHSINVIRGKFDRPEDEGEISHFRALTSALSATVGLGNIAGVAVAIQLGGPGAVFWMWLAAVFGMAAKFSSCTLSQMYRKVNEDGSISGGPMYYLDLGLKDMGMGGMGKILGIMFAIMVMGGAIGGGNMFQANQTAEAITNTFKLNDNLEISAEGYQKLLAENPDHIVALESIARTVDGKVHVHLGDLNEEQQIALGDTLTVLKDQAGKTANMCVGIVLAIFAGVVILGGIKRIGAATCRIVPLMCGLYVLASLYIIIMNAGQVPATILLIFKMAFTDNAFYGGMVGVLVWGIKRAAFSNEAGLGSAAIAHAAAKTNEPVREGIVAMIGPFIDTIVVCTMTALVVIVTGTWNDPTIPQSAGVSLTTAAFGSAADWFPYLLTGCIALFAYSTMISWCYYGERGWIYLLDHAGNSGVKSVVVFRIVFVLAIIFGAVNPLKDVLDFSDAMILSMAFPNIVGSVFLAPKVWALVQDYWRRFTSGEMKPVS